RLRAALRALGRGSRPGEACPAPDLLWAALHGERPVEERRDVIDHIAGCASCAEAWRLAAEIDPAPPRLASAAGRPWLADRLGSSTYVPLAAAAALLLAIGGGLFLVGAPRTAAPVYRNVGPAPIVALVSEREPLTRDAFRLRWS